MVDSRFFKRSGDFTVDQLAKQLKCEVVGDGNAIIKDVATLLDAGPGDIAFLNDSFLRHRKYIDLFKNTKATACIIDEKDIPIAPPGVTLLVTDQPALLYTKVALLLYPHERGAPKVSSSANISEKAQIGNGCVIEDFVVIKDNVIIGDNVFIGAGSYIDSGVKIGANTVVHSNVVLSYCLLGDNCIIYHGAKIGQDGFGFAMGTTGNMVIRQLGRVVLGNGVEIGTNTCIDRGAIGDTIIGDNTKIDNLVQLGHQVEIGQNCLIAGQVGIAGGAIIGNNVMIGGQVGIAGHVSIGDSVKIAAKSGVMEDVPAGSVIGGIPAVPVRDWHKQSAVLRKLIKGRKKQ
ncbi:UDP-3-O-(3-hydroxymyristoyl)glucosamine N-acyltransferase [Rickettsiales endosymbiont of Peranema trichophorum]|uniref:UDP-3-O-(3-hydroxymyristoyl)glucosamine N-acyltransferase n=1 Tax=Rickettsiales endosymbiont of Peranema trichophorum TaxID=2486577 RepID=UPI0013EEDBDF|nr:UDP-3-O-(3-hydroxymyristoyl)glucosamine N-acyltransferase [Rickettsiales endosymbiont of Peranema trichophorum]